MTAYKYRKQAMGLHILETVKSDLAKAQNPRAKAFDLLDYARLTDDARAYLQQYVSIANPPTGAANTCAKIAVRTIAYVMVALPAL